MRVGRVYACVYDRNSFSVSTIFSSHKINNPHFHFHRIHITVQTFTEAGLAFHSHSTHDADQTTHNVRFRNSNSFARPHRLRTRRLLSERRLLRILLLRYRTFVCGVHAQTFMHAQHSTLLHSSFSTW